MRKLDVAAAARGDIQRILQNSQEVFGDRARKRYRSLIEQSLRDLVEDPERGGTAGREELATELRLYHIRHSRARVAIPPKQASHLILFRYNAKCVFVLRVLHEAMDVLAHTEAGEDMPQRESTAISDIEYDEASRQMRVTFTTGRIYIYIDVPLEEYDAFVSADSRGRHFNLHIRDRHEHRELR